MTDAEFKGRYPRIWHFLDTVIRPDVDGYNLFEMLDRVIRRASPEAAEQLVSEFEALGGDETVSPEDLEAVFGTELESPYLVVRRDNAKDLVHSLAEYLRYLVNTYRS